MGATEDECPESIRRMLVDLITRGFHYWRGNGNECPWDFLPAIERCIAKEIKAAETRVALDKLRAERQ